MKNTVNSIKLKRKLDLFVQLTIIAYYPVLFHLLAILGSANNNLSSVKNLLLPGCLFVVFFVFLTVSLLLFRKCKKEEVSTDSDDLKDVDSSGDKKQYLTIMAILVIFSFLIRIPMVGTMQRWDSGEYFYRVGTAVEKYDYTVSSFLTNFSIAAHPNHGFSSFVAMPLFFGARQVTLLTIWQIIFSVLAIMAVYSILKNTFEFKNIQAAIAAFMIGNVPIFLGLSVYCTPDYYAILFFIYALFFGTKKKYIMETFCLLMMCTSKETMSLVVLGYFGIRILVRFFGFKGKLSEKIKDSFKNPDLWIAVVTGVLFVFIMGSFGKSWIGSQNDKSEVPIFVGYIRAYLIVKLEQYLFSNFAWIFSILLTLSIVLFFFKKSKNKYCGEGNLIIAGIFGGMSMFAAFGLLVHIDPLERYNSYFAVSFALLVAVMLNLIIKNRKITSAVSLIMAILLGLESFYTFDPVTRKMFKQMSVGNGHTINYESEEDFYFGDELVTNYQYSWLDKSYNKLLKDIDFSKEDGMYFPDIEAAGNSGLQLWGNTGVYYVGWNESEKRRGYHDKNDKDWVKIELKAVSDIKPMLPAGKYYSTIIDTGNKSDKAYMCFIPYYEEKLVEEDAYMSGLSDYFYVSDRRVSQAYYGEIGYYPMISRDRFSSRLSMGRVLEALEEYRASEKAAPGETDYDPELYLSKENDEKLTQDIVRQYSHNRAKHMLFKGLNYEQRQEIEPYDKVYVSMTLKDKSGNHIPLSYENKEILVNVGVGEVLEEFDKKLLEMNAGESATVDFVVPEDYPELEAYAGQTLTADFTTGIIAHSMIYDQNYRHRKNDYKLSVDEVFDDKSRTDVKNIVKGCIADYYEKVEVDPGFTVDTTKVDDYFVKYLKKVGVSEEEFISEYFKTDKETFEECKKLMAYSENNVGKYNKDISKLKRYYRYRFN